VASAELFTLFGPRMMPSRGASCAATTIAMMRYRMLSSPLQKPGHFEAKSRLCTWLHRITVNCCLKRIRISSSRKETRSKSCFPHSIDRAITNTVPLRTTVRQSKSGTMKRATSSAGRSTGFPKTIEVF